MKRKALSCKLGAAGYIYEYVNVAIIQLLW
jgi:hypothetical protein